MLKRIRKSWFLPVYIVLCLLLITACTWAEERESVLNPDRECGVLGVFDNYTCGFLRGSIGIVFSLLLFAGVLFFILLVYIIRYYKNR